jgi:osmoprotectant transport system permease protein
LLVLLLRPAWLQGAFAPFADNGAPVIYDRASLLDLTLAHLGTVALSSLIGTLVAVAAGIAVTRPWGADFLPVARSVADIGRRFRRLPCSRWRCRRSGSG